MKTKLIGSGIVILAGVLLSLSLFTLPAGQFAVVTQFGKPVATLSEPGLKWKLPGFLQRVNRIDARMEVFNTQPIQLLLGDKNPIIITTFIAWQVKDPLQFYQSLLLPETARQKLADMVISVLGNSLADYTLDQIINPDASKVKLTEIEQRVWDTTTQQAQTKYGVDVTRIGFRRLSYPEIVTEAVYNRMRAERDKEAKKYHAEGTEEAAKIEAETDKEVSEILAQAYKESETLKGKGDRDAARIYAEAYGRDPEFYDFLRSINLYREAFKGRSTLILSTESELFRYLESPDLPKERK